MLRYVKMDLADTLGFADDPDAGECGRPTLDEFLSIRTRSLAKDGPAERLEEFAAKYGPLLGDEAGIPVPPGAGCFREDVSALARGGLSVHFEEKGLWRFHIDAMRDIALLHSHDASPWGRRKANSMRVVQGNCISFEREDGAVSCLYHGTNGSLYGEPPVPPHVPDDVASYLKATGAGFAACLPLRKGTGTMEEKAEWLDENAGKVMFAYVNDYLSRFPAPAGTLLEHLQRELIALTEGSRPTLFCILCGGVATGHHTHFDSNPCRALYYRVKDGLVADLAAEGGYSRETAETMLSAAREGGYRPK